MKTIEYIRWADPPLWKATLANLLPLWLLSIAITTEGFPKPPVPISLAVTAFVLAIASAIALLWLRWLTPELLLYSLFPFVILVTFDEISTSFKTPFILLCALILSAGIIGYQRSRPRSVGLSWLILFLVLIVTWALASHAIQNYWQMVSDLGYVECMPDYQGCAPLTGTETPWWILFFGP